MPRVYDIVAFDPLVKQRVHISLIRGHIQFTSGANNFDARAGDSFVVPGGTEHQACAVEKSEVLDVFTPFREDYAENG
jgi:quercetin dioxygenase-like cupin family protein